MRGYISAGWLAGLAWSLGVLAVEPGVAQMARLREQVAQFLTTGRAVQAELLLKDAGYDPLLRERKQDLESLQELVHCINDKDALILSGYEDDVGKTITIRLVRAEERWTLDRVTDRYIMVSRGSGRTIERSRYRAGDLHYAEQMDRLAKSKSRFAPHVRGLLAWQLGQRDLARDVLSHTADEWGKWLLGILDRPEKKSQTAN